MVREDNLRRVVLPLGSSTTDQNRTYFAPLVCFVAISREGLCYARLCCFHAFCSVGWPGFQ